MKKVDQESTMEVSASDCRFLAHFFDLKNEIFVHLITRDTQRGF